MKENLYVQVNDVFCVPYPNGKAIGDPGESIDFAEMNSSKSTPDNRRGPWGRIEKNAFWLKHPD